MHENLIRIKAVNEVLIGLKQEFVFVGGATVSLYNSNPEIVSDIRPTDDVDVIIELASYGGYAEIDEKLRALGFKNDIASGVICRYHIQGIIVDIMPTDPKVIGFSNRWYPEGFANAIDFKLDGDTTNRIKNACINAGYLKALSKDANSKIKALMASTFLNSNQVNLRFSSMPFPSTAWYANADAYTADWNPTNGLSQQIAFNENILSKKSEEYIVATVYHEILHAYLGNILAKDTDGNLIIPSDHENMVYNYLNMLIADLQSLYPNMGDTDAWALSWGGLERTSRYILLTTDQKTTIANVNQQYSTKPTPNSTINSKGSYCQ